VNAALITAVAALLAAVFSGAVGLRSLRVQKITADADRDELRKLNDRTASREDMQVLNDRLFREIDRQDHEIEELRDAVQSANARATDCEQAAAECHQENAQLHAEIADLQRRLHRGDTP
jgi:uncharacterized protein HemX